MLAQAFGTRDEVKAIEGLIKIIRTTRSCNSRTIMI